MSETRPCVGYSQRGEVRIPCRVRGRHLAECGDETCTGCLPRHADAGQLCEQHAEKLADALRDMPDLWQRLEEYLPPGSGGGRERVGGTYEDPSPVNLSVADHRALISETLGEWLLLHFEESTAPRLPINWRNPATSAPWLSVRLAWAVGQDWVGDYVFEVTSLAGKARGLLNPTGRRRIAEIGPCPEPGCGGVLAASVAQTDDLYPSEIQCSVNSDHVWPCRGRAWIQLGARIRGEAA